MILNLIFAILLSYLQPIFTDSFNTTDTTLTLKIYLSPLTTEEDFEFLKSELNIRGYSVYFQNVTFSQKGYLVSYEGNFKFECNGKEYASSFQSNFKNNFNLAIIFIGEKCQYGSVHLSSLKSDVTNFFFRSSIPDFEHITWVGRLSDVKFIDENLIFKN